MRLFTFLLISLSLVFSLPVAADSTLYKTEAKPPAEPAQKSWSVPVISVNPDTSQKRVFITPDGSFSHELASHGAQVYHARAFYEPTSPGILDSTVKLHGQMADACPQGWIKLQEWANLQTAIPELHYQFQCLEP